MLGWGGGWQALGWGRGHTRLRGGWGQHMAPFSPASAHVGDTLPLLVAVPASACASPQPGAGTGTGTLPLCWAVMRFLLGCLDRKSQPEDAKSVSELRQPPAPAQPEASGDIPTPAPTALPGGASAPAPARNTHGMHEPMALHPVHPTPHIPAPLVWPPQTSWGCQAHPWGPWAVCHCHAHPPVCPGAGTSTSVPPATAAPQQGPGGMAPRLQDPCVQGGTELCPGPSNHPICPTAAANPSPEKVGTGSAGAGGCTELCWDRLCSVS